MVSDSDAWVGWVVTRTRGLKCRNGAGKRGLESRTDKLDLRKGTESDDWSAERGPNNEEWIGRKSIEKRGLDCWYGIGKRCLGQKDVYEKAKIGMPEWCRQARLGVQEGRVSFKKKLLLVYQCSVLAGGVPVKVELVEELGSVSVVRSGTADLCQNVVHR